MFSRRRADAELDSELQFHAAQLIDEHMAAGLSRDEATRRARLDFGGDLQTREACREVRGVQWLDTLTRDLGTVRRLFFTAPGFSAAIVTVLAVGIGTTAAIVALVNAVIIRPLPYPNADRLVSVYHAASGTALPMTGLSTGTLLHYQSENRVFDDIASYQDEVATLTAPGEPGRIRIAVASPSLFTTLNVRPFLGRFPVTGDVDTDADGLFLHATVAISHDLWVRRFGADPNVVGRPISIGAWRSLTVVGVAEPEFHFPHAETQVWIGAPPEVRNNRSRASIRGLYEQGIARLKPGVTEAEANQDLQRMVAMLPAAFSDVTAEQLQEIGFQAAVLPLKDAIVGDVRLPLLLLITMGAFLLLITWANVTNLSLVRAGRLRREVAVARALGAGERHLVHRLLSESIALAAIGGLLGLLLANRAIALRFGFDVEQIPRLNEVSMDGAVYALVLALAATSALLLGAVAFVSTRRADLTEALRGATGRVSDGRRQQMGRRVLVSAQVALSVPLLVGSALLAESFWQLNRVDLGFQSAGALTFTVPIPPTMSPAGDYYNGVARIHADIRRRIRALPGVTATESTSIFPLMSGHRGYLLRLSAGSPASERADDWHYTYLSYATRTTSVPWACH